MSFCEKDKGEAYAPGWFLADNENCTRLTYQVGGDDYAGTVRETGGRKIVPAGSLFPSKSAPTGIVYEDIDVTSGAKPASIVTAGKVYRERVEDEAEIEGIVYEDEPEITRPY
jgi:hypothetical protein